MKMRQGSPYTWDAAAARFRDQKTGRFVKIEVVQQWANDSIAASQDVVRSASLAVGNGTMQASDWFNTMRDEIKGEYIRQYLSGIGGRNMMTPADWGSVGGMIADQYRYLNEFYSEVQSGNLSPEAIDARARMYINSAREAFSRAILISHKVAKYSKKEWELGATTDHCKNCPVFAALGWVDIDYQYMVDGREAFPGNGATQCLTACLCNLRFKK